ncbi:MAG: ABC transporter substrate-binding protein [Ilumatobacter sp.]|uniref:ABC transporter substrate-binding protein n=1 Tax=Ilumatobacter sp. TaxID=1967498 RepID=UPI003C7085E5
MYGSHHTTSRSGARRSLGALLVTFALATAACASSDDDASTTEGATPAETDASAEATVETDPPAETESTDTEAPDTEAPATEAPDTEPEGEEPAVTEAPADGGTGEWTSAFPDLAPPTGDEMVVGLVNSEGSPGLDFPDVRNFTQATVDYLNEHGGFGDRPVKLETCATNGSPEGSQACAQELTGKNVEMVIIGLDVFVDYATYEAAGTPLVGMLPILPTDNTANARFLTGGNSTTVGAMAAVVKDFFAASKVAIVSADNAGANATEAALAAALDVAGVEHSTVKGGDNETDAGFQGLMRQAADSDPDVLISLYADAGCIGTMRGRASLGIEIPVVTTAICADSDVIAEVGDDALGWHFVGIAGQQENAELDILREILAPTIGVAPEEVDSTALGLGGLGLTTTLSIAGYANLMVEAGEEVTGPGIFDFIAEGEGLTYWPGDTDIECGAAEGYSAICAYTFPVATYDVSGEVVTVEGLEKVSSIPYLPAI